MKALAVTAIIVSLIGGAAASDAEDMFDDADSNYDEVLEYQELTAVFPQATRALFDLIDLNRDGKLNYDEFRLGREQGYFQNRRLSNSITRSPAKRSTSSGPIPY